MRHLTGHIVNPANDRLVVTADDEPGSGGASHLYTIRGYDSSSNPSDPFVARYGSPSNHSTVLFQNGPIGADGNGVNGITHEALLEILIDRLKAFQAGPYANEFNREALNAIQYAQTVLRARTRARMKRGVEGTHTV